MNQALRGARVVVGLTAVALPLGHAALVAAVGGTVWTTAAAVSAGLMVRLAAGATPAVVIALSLAPVWLLIVSANLPPGHFFHLVPWTGFLGAALAWPGPRPWKADGVWGGAIAAWALVLALVTPVVVLRELDFSPYAAAAPNDAGMVLVAAGAQLVALLLFDWYWGATAAARRLAWVALSPGVALAAAVALWQQHVDATLLGVEPWLHLRRAGGTLFDANATGALLALTAPFLLSSMVRPPAIPALAWGAVWLALCAGGILATGSRSALTSLALVLALQTPAAARPLRWLALAAGALLAAAVLTNDPPTDPSTGHAIGRLADTVQRGLALGREGLWLLLWDRYGYGPAAMAMIADHPVVGVGPGTFGALVTGYATETLAVALPPDNAQNWWRQQAAELGLLGALPSFGCSLLVLAALARAFGRREHVAAAAPLAGLGLLALISPPMPHPLLQVVVALVIAQAVVSWPAPAGVAPRKRDGLVVWVLAIACAVGTVGAGWRDLRPPYRAARFHRLYSYGVSASGPTPYGDGRWMAQHGVAVLEPAGATLVTRIVVPQERGATRALRVTVSTRDGVACVHEAIDTTPFECRTPVGAGAWPMVRVDIGQPWPLAPWTTRAAVVTARFED